MEWLRTHLPTADLETLHDLLSQQMEEYDDTRGLTADELLTDLGLSLEQHLGHCSLEALLAETERWLTANRNNY